MAKTHKSNNLEDLQKLLEQKEKDTQKESTPNQAINEAVSLSADKIIPELNELNDLAKEAQIDAKSKSVAEADLKNQKDGFEKLNPEEKAYIEKRAPGITAEIANEKDLIKRVELQKRLSSITEEYQQNQLYGKDTSEDLPDLGMYATGNVAQPESRKTQVRDTPGKRALRKRKDKEEIPAKTLPKTKSGNTLLFDGSQTRGKYTQYGTDIPYEKYVKNYGDSNEHVNTKKAQESSADVVSNDSPTTHMEMWNDAIEKRDEVYPHLAEKESQTENTAPLEARTHMEIWEDAIDERSKHFPDLAEKTPQKNDVSYGEAMQHYIDNHEDAGAKSTQDREAQFADALEFHYGDVDEKPLSFEAYQARLADAKNHLDTLRSERDAMVKAGTNRGSAAYAAIEQKISDIQNHITKLEGMDVEQQSSVEAAAENNEAITTAKKAFDDAQKDYDYVMKGDGVNNSPAARHRAKTKLAEAKKHFYEVSGGRDEAIENTLAKFDRKKTAGGLGKRIDKLREKHPHSSENLGKFMAWRKRNKWACRAMSVGVYAGVGGVWYATQKVTNMATGGALGAIGSWVGGKLHEKLYDKKYNQQAETVAALEKILEEKKTTMSPALIAEYRNRIKATTEGLSQTQVEKRRRWKIVGAIAGAGSYAAYNLMDTPELAPIKEPTGTEFVFETPAAPEPQAVVEPAPAPKPRVEVAPQSTPEHVESYGNWEYTDDGKVNVETGEVMTEDIAERIEASRSGNDFLTEGRQRNYPHGRNGSLLVNDGTFSKVQNIVGMDDLFQKQGVPMTEETFHKLGFRYLDDETMNKTGKVFTNINDGDMGTGYSLTDIYEHLDFNKARSVLAGVSDAPEVPVVPNPGITPVIDSGFDSAPSVFTDPAMANPGNGFDSAPEKFEQLSQSPTNTTNGFDSAPDSFNTESGQSNTSGFDAAPDTFEQLNQSSVDTNTGFDTAPQNFENLNEGAAVNNSEFASAPENYTAPVETTAENIQTEITPETSPLEEVPLVVTESEQTDIDPELFSQEVPVEVVQDPALETETTPDIDSNLFEEAQPEVKETLDQSQDFFENSAPVSSENQQVADINEQLFSQDQITNQNTSGSLEGEPVVNESEQVPDIDPGLFNESIPNAATENNLVFEEVSASEAVVENTFEFDQYSGESGPFTFENIDKAYFTEQNFKPENIPLQVPTTMDSEFAGVSLVRTPDGQWAVGMSRTNSAFTMSDNMGNAMNENVDFLKKMGIDAGPSAFGDKNGIATAYTPLSEEQAKFIYSQYEQSIK